MIKASGSADICGIQCKAFNEQMLFFSLESVLHKSDLT